MIFRNFLSRADGCNLQALKTPPPATLGGIKIHPLAGDNFGSAQGSAFLHTDLFKQLSKTIGTLSVKKNATFLRGILLGPRGQGHVTWGHEKFAYRFPNNPIFIGLHFSPKKKGNFQNVGILLRLSVDYRDPTFPPMGGFPPLHRMI